MDDGTFTVPAGFRDRTVNALEWRTPDGEKLALIVQREPLVPRPDEEPSATLERHVATQTKSYPAQFTGYHVERSEVSAPDSAFEVRRLAFRWLNEQDLLYHHQAFVRMGERVLVLTSAAKARYRDAVDSLIDGALNDLRMRAD
jgi:hypothetical protein